MGIGQNQWSQRDHGISKAIGYPRGKLNLINLEALEDIDSILPIGLKDLIITLINAKELVHNQYGITINHKSFDLKLDGDPKT